MLGWRLTISAILIPALIAVFVLDHRAGETAPYLLGLSMLLVWRGSFEFADLLRTRSFNPSFVLIGFCSTAIVSASWLPHVSAPFLLFSRRGPISLIGVWPCLIPSFLI